MVAPGPPASTVDRLDYSNDSAALATKGPLSVVGESISATGNSDFGYFGGMGASYPGRTLVDRIDYSNDTATAAAKGNLNTAKYRVCNR